MTFNISILGAGGGPEIHISGDGSGAEGIELGQGQVDGIYHAPVSTEWAHARQQRGASFAAMEYPERDMQLGFHVMDNGGDTYQDADDLLRSAFTYQLDPWWPGDTLARIAVDSGDSYRTLSVQMYDEPQFKPDIDPDLLQYGNVFYKLRAAQPFWESQKVVTSWQTGSASGSGTIPVSNPTGVEMFQCWVLTPGTWVVPDFSWTGAPGKRVPGGLYGTRKLSLLPVTTAMQSLTIDLDPMHVMMQSKDGQNVMGQVGGGYYFMHTIPPHTPKTDLPISVSGAPAGGARAELHQPRLWHNLIGSQ